MINETNMMHGRDYSGQDVTGWLMSEKLNGCRAYWDGQQMWSRGGNAIAIPAKMVASLPPCPLDGELHAGRDGYEISRRFVQYGEWDDRIQLSVFDAPQVKGDFLTRYTWLENNLSMDGIVNYIQHVECVDIDDAVAFMWDIQDCYGGEGVVLRAPWNVYEAAGMRMRRTPEVLKLKERP